MKHAVMFIAGLVLAYLAVGFGDQTGMPYGTFDFGIFMLIVAGILLAVVSAFYFINNIILDDESERAIGHTSLWLFVVMTIYVACTYVYGLLFQPVTHKGLEPWNWFGMGNVEDIGLVLIFLLPALMLQHFWLEGWHSIRAAAKKGDPYVENQKRIYNALEEIKRMVSKATEAGNNAYIAIQAHDEHAGGKVTNIQDVMLPKIGAALDHVITEVDEMSRQTAAVYKKISPPNPEEPEASASGPHLVSPKKAAGGGGGPVVTM